MFVKEFFKFGFRKRDWERAVSSGEIEGRLPSVRYEGCVECRAEGVVPLFLNNVVGRRSNTVEQKIEVFVG